MNARASEDEALHRGKCMICPGVRVLVVDDEPMNLMVAKGIFREYQMNVTTAESGREAIELCEKEDFDLVFLDHMMPEMDGVETLKRLRRIHTDTGRDVTVIAFTANAVSGAGEMFLREGFDEFISKPIEPLEMGKRAQSEAPGVADYEEFFAEQLAKAQYIIHIAMAKHVSQGYENALEASKTFDNVFVIDSGHLSSGMGLMVLRAAEYAADGMSADDIVNKTEYLKKQVKTSFIVNSTEYLARSGRISSKINTLCHAFMIHPVIVLKNSSMKVGAVRIGTRDYAWEKYIASTLNAIEKVDKKTLFITYVGLTNEELKEIEKQVMSKGAFENIIYQKASQAISANCGPGTFGLLFMLKD